MARFPPPPTFRDPLTFSHRHERSCRTIHLAIPGIPDSPSLYAFFFTDSRSPFASLVPRIYIYIFVQKLCWPCSFDRRFDKRRSRDGKGKKGVGDTTRVELVAFRDSLRISSFLLPPPSSFFSFSGNTKARKGPTSSFPNTVYRGNFKGRDWMDVKRIEAIAPWTNRGGLSKLFSYPFSKNFESSFLPSFLLSFVQ